MMSHPAFDMSMFLSLKTSAGSHCSPLVPEVCRVVNHEFRTIHDIISGALLSASLFGSSSPASAGGGGGVDAAAAGSCGAGSVLLEAVLDVYCCHHCL